MSGAVSVFDDTPCQLGEGPMWHPARGAFLWFDINEKKMFSRGIDAKIPAEIWQFDEHVSAAGWLDDTHVLIATETALVRFCLTSGAKEVVAPLEADTPATRSNDGRADPWGGFWIGTMGKNAEEGAGAIYRYYRGEVRRMFAPWTIPNAICFTPDRRFAYLTDTPRGIIWRQALAETDGWPKGAPEQFLTLPATHYRPDGAVVDTAGNLWCAHFGQGKLTCHAPDGTELRSVALPARQTTCPAFGGADCSTLIVTTAAKGPAGGDPNAGLTYRLTPDATGQAEHRVIL